VVVNLVDPGFCKTDLSRNVRGLGALMFLVMKALWGRTAEQGARNLLLGAVAGEESHVGNISSGRVKGKGWVISRFV
jgi:retinol dehydrogenase 12